MGRMRMVALGLALLFMTGLAGANQEAGGTTVAGCAQTSGPPDAAAELAKSGCKIENLQAECQDWFRQNPSMAPYARGCDSAESNRSPFSEGAAGCVSAFGEVWSDMVKGVKDGAVAVADQVRRNTKEDAECDGDKELTCKRKLAKEAYFNYKSDDELREVSAMDLRHKRDQLVSLAKRDPAYRMKLQAAGVPLPDFGSGTKLGEASVGDLKKLADGQLDKLGVRYQCYNGAGYAKMACAAAATVIDPTVAAGLGFGALRGAAWAMRALKAGRLERAGSALAKGAEAAKAGEAAKVTDAGGSGSTQSAGAARGAATGEGRGLGPAGVKNLIEDMKSPSYRLDKERMRALTREERIQVAEAVAGPLSDAQKKAVWDAHLVGADAGKDFGQYSKPELLQKTRILAGTDDTGKPLFTADQRRALMERGVTGGDPFAGVPEASTTFGANQSPTAVKFNHGLSAQAIETAADNVKAVNYALDTKNFKEISKLQEDVGKKLAAQGGFENDARDAFTRSKSDYAKREYTDKFQQAFIDDESESQAKAKSVANGELKRLEAKLAEIRAPAAERVQKIREADVANGRVPRDYYTGKPITAAEIDSAMSRAERLAEFGVHNGRAQIYELMNEQVYEHTVDYANEARRAADRASLTWGDMERMR